MKFVLGVSVGVMLVLTHALFYRVGKRVAYKEMLEPLAEFEKKLKEIVEEKEEEVDEREENIEGEN